MSASAELDIDPLNNYNYNHSNPYRDVPPPLDLGLHQPINSAPPKISPVQPTETHVEAPSSQMQSTISSLPGFHEQPINYIQPYDLNVKYEPQIAGQSANDQPVNNLNSAENVVSSHEESISLPNVKNESESNIDTKKGIVENTSELTIVIKQEVSSNSPIRRIKKNKKNGEKSTYMSEKIEPGFPFYGCSLCNINYPTLQELDVHVTTHKNRFTSYDLRIKNQIRRKKLRKEQKRMKKLGAIVKQEPVTNMVEIKPEDGYIGMEPTTEFMNNFNNAETENSQTSNDNSQNSVENGATTNCITSFDVKTAALEIKRMIQSEQHNLNNLQKIYKCFACNKQFTLSYYLKLHVRSHTDEKPYKCKECDQSFITASKLGRHIKRIHLAIKYTCRICYKLFTRFEYLTRHFDKKHIEDKLEGEPYDYNAILPYLKELEEQFQIKTEDIKPKTEGLWSDDWPELTANADNMSQTINQSEGSSSHPEVDSKIPESDTNQSDMVATEPEVGTKEPEVDAYVPEISKYEPDEQSSHFEMEHDNHLKSNSDDDDDDDYDSSHFDEEPFMPGNHLDIMIEEVKVPMDDVKEQVEVEVEVKIKEEKPDSVKSEPVVKNEDSSDEDYFPSNTWASTPKVDQDPPSPPKKKRQKTEGPLKCKECDKTINSTSYMKVHMRTHTGEKPFKCYICERGFITSSKMHRHVLTHGESWADEKTVKKEDGGVEEEKDEDKKDNESLKKAKAKFNKPSKKKTGEGKKRHQKRPHACEFCQQKFLHLETLNVHKKSHEGEAVRRRCNFCLEEFEDEEKMKTHEKSHEGTPKPYLCTICGRSYKRRETMIYHRKHHKPEKMFTCDMCKKSFNAQCKLQRHIVSHRVDKFVLRYECPVCAHMFHTKYHIQMHLSTHQKEGLISEENRNDILAMVLQNARKIPKATEPGAPAPEAIPADERSRVCNICGEVFQHFYYLEEHLKSHGSKIAIEDLDKEEEKKYVCQVCSKGFKLHYYLKLHTFTHTKEKPYVCQQCSKGFITKGKLKRHLETHTGLKKYQCHICYKFFTRPSYLRIHVRTIHGTQDYNFKMKQYSLPPFDGHSVFADRSI